MRASCGTMALMARKVASTGPSPVDSWVCCLPSTSSVSVARCGPPVPAITVIDVLLAIGERLEAHEGVLESVVAELVAELVQFLAESMTPGVLAHDERGFLQPDALWRHDLEGLSMLEDAVLVNAALMRERVPSDDGLVEIGRA